MRFRVLSLTAALAAGGVVAACGEDEPAARAATATTPAPAATAAAGATPVARRRATGLQLKLKGSPYGNVLFDGRDHVVYLFDKERSRRSQCYGACAAAWPPVLTRGKPRAGSGVRARLLGTTKRRDGTTQVTYKGHPLYYYVHDGAGQVLCHNVREFGGLWLVVKRNGDAAG